MFLSEAKNAGKNVKIFPKRCFERLFHIQSSIVKNPLFLRSF